MASEDCIDSALTSEPDNLIELHELSGLPTEHRSRRTKTGFVIRASRLPNCVPLPANKKAHRSWIWKHGESVGYCEDNTSITKCWVCIACYHKDPIPKIPTFLLSVEKNTTKIIDHLEDLHQFDRLGNKLHQSVSKKRKQESLDQ